MYKSDLPTTQVPLGKRSIPGILAAALRYALAEETAYVFSDIISGQPRSGRVLSPHSLGDSVSLGAKLTPEEMAQELIAFGKKEARYDPPISPRGFDFHKGWEVYSAVINNYPVAIVWTAWTEH